MTEKPEITYDTMDSRGYVPNQALINSKWKHSGNGHIYTITGFFWNGEDDTWLLGHMRTGSNIMYMRTPANFFGYRNGQDRYEPVS